MEKLRTSLTIMRHSFSMMGRHPRLLVFPVLSLVATVLVVTGLVVEHEQQSE